MSRLLLAALAALLLAVPATATGSPNAQLQGTVGAKLSRGLIRVDATRMSHFLRVSGPQARIHVGQRVELRGSLLRQRGSHSRILARNVVLVRSLARSMPTATATSGASGTDDGNAEHPNGDDHGNPGPGKAADDDSGDQGSAAPANGNDDDTGDDESGDDDSGDDSGDDDHGDDNSGHGHSDDD